MDFSKEVLKRRKELIPQLKEERKKGRIAHIKYDSLIEVEASEMRDKRKSDQFTSPKTPNDIENGPTKINKINDFERMYKSRAHSTSHINKDKQSTHIGSRKIRTNERKIINKASKPKTPFPSPRGGDRPIPSSSNESKYNNTKILKIKENRKLFICTLNRVTLRTQERLTELELTLSKMGHIRFK